MKPNAVLICPGNNYTKLYGFIDNNELQLYKKDYTNWNNSQNTFIIRIDDYIAYYFYSTNRPKLTNWKLKFLEDLSPKFNKNVIITRFKSIFIPEDI